MPWCPNCKHEYREGITVCADCGEALVDELPDEAEDAEWTGEAFLFDVIPGGADREEAPEEDEREGARAIPGVYQASAERAEENRSSAWVLLIIGGLGLLAVILGMTGILPLRLGNAYLFYGVMIAVFLLFVVMGIVSMKNSRVFTRKARSESSLEDKLVAWAKENVDGAEIDARIAQEVPHLQEEGPLYYRRTAELRKRLNAQFVGLDPAFLEYLIDGKLYDLVFPDAAPDETGEAGDGEAAE